MTRGYGITLVLCLAAAGLADLALEPGWFLLATYAVAALAVVALLRPAERWPVIVVTGSLLLTVGCFLTSPPVATFGLAEAGTLVLLVVASTRRADRRRRWAVTVLVAAAAAVLPLRFGVIADSPVLAAALTLVVAVAVAVGSALRGADAARRAAVTAVRRLEREEVARELHDVVAHHVTGMVVATQAARVITKGTGAGLDPTLASIEAAGVEALAAMRRLVEVLRTDPDDPGTAAEVGATSPGPRTPVPQADELTDLVRRFEVTAGAGPVQLRGSVEDLAGVPVEVQTALYRVTQEALTNTARHAPGADRVVVQVARGGGEVSVRITDSGTPGVHRSQEAGLAGGGFGLVGMRERVDALGGSLTVGPHGRGWLVRADFPDLATGVGMPATISSGLPNRRSRRRKG